MTRGVLFIANGLEHQRECGAAVLRLWETGNDLPVHIVCAGDIGQHASQGMRPSLYVHSPFYETIALDTDVRVNEPLDELWQLLQNGPAVFLARDPTETWANHLRQGWAVRQAAGQLDDSLPPDAPVYNAGVIMWRRGLDAQLFFTKWRTEYDRLPPGSEEPALARTARWCKEHQMKLGEIPARFNWPRADASIEHPFRGPPTRA